MYCQLIVYKNAVLPGVDELTFLLMIFSCFQGCYSVVTDFMKNNMSMIGGIALGVSFFQVCDFRANIFSSNVNQGL